MPNQRLPGVRVLKTIKKDIEVKEENERAISISV